MSSRVIRRFAADPSVTTTSRQNYDDVASNIDKQLLQTTTSVQLLHTRFREAAGVLEEADLYATEQKLSSGDCGQAQMMWKAVRQQLLHLIR